MRVWQGVQSRGFTLLEMMIVVIIVGILATIAYPSYLEYLKQAKRAEASAVLIEAAQAAERHFSKTGSYNGAQIPTRSPVVGDAEYNVALVTGNVAQGSYVITASSVSDGMMVGDECETMTINALGVRGPTNDKCWRKLKTQ